MLTETNLRLLRKFIINFGLGGMRAVGKFQKRIKKADAFPAFLFISVTNACNLSCQGCWVRPTKPPRELDIETLNKIILQCKENGTRFFGILGGEPLLHDGIFELFDQNPDCYFLLFTNGTLITHETARRLNQAGNVSPLISVEGLETVSDERRNGKNVYSRALEGIEHCRKHKLITGVATSVCKSNIEDLATESFLQTLIDRGVHYMWYYVYRPVGPDPSPKLALSPDQIHALRKFIVESRKKHPILIVDSYWDHEGRAMCPAAVGIGHHISPAGDIEPCPPIQFAAENIMNGKSMSELFNESEFLHRFKQTAAEATRGCIIMERPDLLKDIIENSGAWDSSGRGTAMEELAAMTQHTSHHLKDREIPEKYWPYRFAKKHWFFGFGAYG